jgi:folylpolyglutamate synthase/dihydrofolate synthase
MYPWDSWKINEVTATSDEYDQTRKDVTECWNTWKCAKRGCLSEPLTQFELDVAAVLTWFSQNLVDIAVIEVGMGGRLDATNVFNNACIYCERSTPSQLLASVITAIGFDHVGILGSTIEEIALQKIAICKPNVPCFIGMQNYEVVLPILYNEVCVIGCQGVTWNLRKVSLFENGDLTISVSGGESMKLHHDTVIQLSCNDSRRQVGYQVENFGLAAFVLHHLFPAKLTREIYTSILSHRPQGRLDDSLRLPFSSSMKDLSPQLVPVLLDGAHNLDGAKRLRDYIDNAILPRPVTWILGLCSNKDIHGILRTLLRPKDRVFTVGFSIPLNMPWISYYSPLELSQFGNSLCSISTSAVRVQDISYEALNLQQQPDTCVVIAGSLYLISDVYRWAKKSENFGDS